MLCMEGREGMKPGGFMTVPGVVGSYQPLSAAAPARPVTRVEDPSQGGWVVSPGPPPTAHMKMHQPAPATTSMAATKPLWPGIVGVGMPLKKKKGRPKKYAPNGRVMLPLNPTPISASLPPGQYSAPAAFSLKRGRGRPSGFLIKQHPRLELESLGELVSCSAGANFTPHVISVAAGEGRFELLTLSGSFMPNENGGTKSRSGGMSVSLASPDGLVVGGGVAGLLVAASPVQVVLGSFLPGFQLEQKTKKSELQPSIAIPAAIVQMPAPRVEDSNYNGGHGKQYSSTPKPNPNPTISSSFKLENWSASPFFSV